MYKKSLLSLLIVSAHAGGIKPANLQELNQQYHNEQLAIAGRKLLQTISDRDPRLVRLLLNNPEKWSETRSYREANLQRLAAADFPSASSNNYVVCNDEVCLKIAGQGSRLINLLREYDKQHPEIPYEQSLFKRIWAGQVTTEERDAITAEPTYQTSSRIAVALLVRAAIAANGLTRIKLPQQSLLQFEADKGIEDTNAIVVEEKLKDLVTLEHYLTQASLDNDTIDELCQVIVAGKLWNLNNKLFVSPAREVYLLDVEQPNKMNPSQAYFADAKDLERNVMTGLSQLLEILTSAKQSTDKVVEFINAHPEFKAYDNYNAVQPYVEVQATTA